MKHLFYFLFLPLVFLTTCKEDVPVNPENATNDKVLDDRSISWVYPEVIQLPLGFEAEGVEIGRYNDLYVTALTYSPNPVMPGAIWKGNLLTGEGKILVPPDGVPAVGIEWDERTNYLFVCKGYGLAIYNATTGALVRQYFFAEEGRNVINDVFVSTRAAYMTDSYNPWLYKLPLAPNGQPEGQIEIVQMLGFEQVADPNFFLINANGIVGTPNGRKLIVNNMSTGILYLVDTKYQTATPIRIKDGTPEMLQWGDGLLWDQDRLYVCKNLPNSIAMIKLHPSLKFGWYVKDIKSDLFVEPATIARKGRWLYAANAHFYGTFFEGIDPATIQMEVVRVLKY